MSSAPTATIIDYGAGNLRSLVNSLQEIGCTPTLAQTPQQLAQADRLILPGVGAFGDCLSQIQERGFFPIITKWLEEGRPFFGICVGYQALFSGSEESPETSGLNWFPDQVKRFPSGDWKIPHMGWNQVSPTNPSHPLWQDFPENPFFYFVHSYYPELSNKDLASAYCNYANIRFAAMASNANGTQIATQFHPEKSQENGLRLMQNWLNLTA